MSASLWSITVKSPPYKNDDVKAIHSWTQLRKKNNPSTQRIFMSHCPRHLPPSRVIHNVDAWNSPAHARPWRCPSCGARPHARPEGGWETWLCSGPRAAGQQSQEEQPGDKQAIHLFMATQISELERTKKVDDVFLSSTLATRHCQMHNLRRPLVWGWMINKKKVKVKVNGLTAYLLIYFCFEICPL